MNSVQENQKHVPIDSQLKRHWRNRKRLRLILGVIILLLIVAGFFYWYEKTSQAEAERQRNEGRITEEERLAKVPVLFGKEDYRLEQKAEGQYLLIDRVGFSALIPSGWTIEYVTSSHVSMNKEECYVDLMSPDINKQSSYVKTGCGISISAGFNPELNDIINKKITLLEDPTKDANNFIDKKITYILAEISGQKVIKSTINEKYGEGVGLQFPSGTKNYVDIKSFFPPENNAKCKAIWDQFFKGIVLK